MPERVGKYLIVGTLGSGASATVFLATDPDLDRHVAIKQLSPELASDAGFLDGFRHEAEVMGRLVHPNCVQVYDFLEEKRGAYIVSEYIPGASLRKILEDHGRLGPEQAMAVTRGALSGLAFAHELGLVHRDVKPENLLADRAGVSKLADFGQASFAGEVSGGGKQTTGSPAYMSPEQVRGEPGDVRSDVYSAGAVMYEFLAGRPPFVALSRLAVMKMHLERQPPELSRVNPRVPARLTAVLNQALAKDPGDRFQSAGEFQAVLEEVARDAYGPGWLEAGSIATLVAASAAAAIATASASAATGAVAQAGTADVAEAAAPTAEGAAPTAEPVPEPAAAVPSVVTPEATAAAAIAAPVPVSAPSTTRRPPGIGRGIAAVVAGLMVGGAVSLVAPPSSLGILPAATVLPATTPSPAVSPTPSLSPTAPVAAPTVQSISARFDAASGTTFFDVVGAQPRATYTWAWVKKPACGALQADPGGLTAAFRHQGCDPVGEGRGVVGVCVSTNPASAIYQRNARFGDGAFSPQEAAAAGAAGDQFSQVDSSTTRDLCTPQFSSPGPAAVSALPGAQTPVPVASAQASSPGNSPSAAASASVTPSQPAPSSATSGRLLPLGAGVAVGLLVAAMGLLLLRRGVPRP